MTTVPTLEPGTLLLARPRWRQILGLLRPLLLLTALLAYGLFLGGHGLRLELYVLTVVVFLAVPVVVSLLSFVPTVTGPPPALTRDGIRLRVRPWRKELLTLPWSEVTSTWIGYRGRRPYLCIQADFRGAHADAWDPRGKRFTGKAQPLAVYLPETVGGDQVREAVAALSDGSVTLADRGPEVDTPGRRRVFTEEPRKSPLVIGLVVLLAYVLIGVPWLLREPPVWYQPWFPGVTAAATIPEPCSLLSEADKSALQVTDAGRPVETSGWQYCRYAVQQGDLTILIERPAELFTDGTTAAKSTMEEVASGLYTQVGSRREPVTGVGDEAWVAANPQGTTTLFDRSVVFLVARRANVVLGIAYQGEIEPTVARQTVLAVARTTLAGLDVR